MKWEETLINNVKKAIREGGWIETRVLENRGKFKLRINYYPKKEETDTDEFILID